MLFKNGLKINRNQTGAIVIGGHFQGLGVIRSLGRENIPVLLLDNQLCIGKFSRYLTAFQKCPPVLDEKDFLQFLIELADKRPVRGWVIFPTDDETVYFLAKYRGILSRYYRVTTPDWEVIKFTHDKKQTYKLAEKMGMTIPKTFYPESIEDLDDIDIDFPLIVKPAIVKKFFNVTKEKAYIANDQTQLREAYLKIAKIIDPSEILIQEMIPGDPSHLYSFCPLFKNGEVLARVIARRSRQHPMDLGHASTFAETVSIPELETLGSRFLSRIGYEGIAEVEFKQDPRDGQYKFLEVNTRVWGWHTLAIRAGINLPYLLFRHTLGESIRSSKFKEGIKWVRLLTDIPTVLSEIRKRKLSITNYFKSLKGPKEFAVLSGRDPFPFLAELFLLPYLYYKRGY